MTSRWFLLAQDDNGFFFVLNHFEWTQKRSAEDLAADYVMNKHKQVILVERKITYQRGVNSRIEGE